MNDNFYRALEDRYRGSRELIKSRLGVYIPFAQALLSGDGEAKAVDIGCGRGEWLELIAGLGFDAVGVDLDQNMLDAGHALGLKLEKGDAFTFIAGLPDDSQSIVSAFHVVEHLTFEQLQTLVSQALRVLKPGGLLIMETPNPENIVMATRGFYLDPTHQRPIPPLLLSFLPEYYGFARTKVLRVHESKELAQRMDLTLQDVINGVSPDYAVIAQKAATENAISSLDAPFSLEYGLSLEYLAGRYQDQISERFQQAEDKAWQAEAKAWQAEAKAWQAETASNERLAQLQAVYVSSSWRVTKPLRVIKRILGRDFSLVRRSTAAATVKIKQILRPAMAGSIGYVLNQPKLRSVLSTVMKPFPWLKGRLFRVAVNVGAVGEQVPYANYVPFTLRALTPHARQIYVNLKSAVDKKNQVSF